ncbi:hypothetical protein EJ02DRAFT_309572, partial [Clathrospora elynae]
SPDSVIFVLAGRTTLSEHTPTESIEVAYQIAERSPYLRNFLPQHACPSRNLLPIQLGDVDPAGFRLYVEWLNTGLTKISTHKRLLPICNCIALIYAHIVGSTFNAPNFQDYIIDVMTEILHPAQGPDLKVLEILFLEKHASSLLKRFIIDRMFAHERKMLGMLRGFVEDMMTAGNNAQPGCEYHIHDAEGNCYRDEMVAERGEEGNIKGKGKEWSVDDDAELNAMAAHYLGKTKKISSSYAAETTKTSVTRSLVLECLARLSPRLDGTPTQDLIAECLALLPCRPTRMYETDNDSLISPSNSSFAPYTEEKEDEEEEEIPAYLRLGSPSSTSHLFRDFSFAPLPKALHLNIAPNSPRVTKPRIVPLTQHILLPPSPRTATVSTPTLLPRSSPPLKVSPPYHISPSSLSPHFPPLAKRKPVPPRGVDWVEQWDRLHALQGTQGFGLRTTEKKERKSR